MCPGLKFQVIDFTAFTVTTASSYYYYSSLLLLLLLLLLILLPVLLRPSRAIDYKHLIYIFFFLFSGRKFGLLVCFDVEFFTPARQLLQEQARPSP